MFRTHSTKRKTAKFLNCIGGRCVGVGNANECEINKNKLTQGIFLPTIPIIKKKKESQNSNSSVVKERAATKSEILAASCKRCFDCMKP